MLCPACNKESKNLRVCPYCFTPYPEANTAPGKRASRAMPSTPPPSTTQSPWPGAGPAAPPPPASPLDAIRQQSPVVRWSALGIVVVALLWLLTSGGDGGTGAGSENRVEATAIERDEALAIIRQTRETALVDVQQDEVFVSYPAATFPVREEGQLALVQQFAQADAVAEGRRRRIFFYNPNGKLFAQSDATRGVILVR